MPFPLIPVLLGASAGSSLIGNILSRPKRSTYDPMQIYRKIEEANNTSLNNMLSQTRARYGANLGARGLSGGAAESIIGNMEGDARGQMLAENSRVLAGLLEKKAQVDDQYNADRSAWVGNLFGDLGRAGGAIAGTALGVQGAKQMSGDELQFLIKRLASLNNADPNFIARILAGGSNPTGRGGWNPASTLDMGQGEAW